MDKSFVFTPDNLIENIEKVGAWSSYGLASAALQHYFPSEYDENGNCEKGVIREIELCNMLDCKYWQDVIIKFQNEVGYKVTNPNGFSPDCVNEY
jgi:hypothetical protein